MEDKERLEQQCYKPKPPCPPPPPPIDFEFDCIITTKVYDACRQVECEFFEFEVDLPEEDEEFVPFAEVIPNTVEFKVEEIKLIDGGPLARIQLEVCAQINVYLNDEVVLKTQKVCFKKSVVLYMPEPERMEVVVEAIFQIAGESIIEIEDEEALIFVPVGAWIIVKSTAEVQLLIPTLGFCPLPPLCEELPLEDPCDEFIKLPFPDFYPPQPNND